MQVSKNKSNASSKQQQLKYIDDHTSHTSQRKARQFRGRHRRRELGTAPAPPRVVKMSESTSSEDFLYVWGSPPLVNEKVIEVKVRKSNIKET